MVCLFAFTACGDNKDPQDPSGETVAVTGVKLDKTELTLLEGANGTLNAEVLPENATDKSVKWSIDKPEVASVENGSVTAKAEGTATITVTTVDGNHTAKCALTVNKQTPTGIPVTGVELNKNELTLARGANETLIATVLPGDATNRNVIWSSSNPDLISVNGAGKVTAKEGGEAVTITVKTEEGGFEDHCVVTVTIPVIGVELDKSELALAKDTSESLTAIILPGIATNQTVIWTISDPGVATLAPDGLICEITGTAAGFTTITVRTEYGDYEASCELTVTAAHPLFGEVSFRSTDTKTIGSQIWSDVVMGSECPTSGFDPGYQSGPKAACRNVVGSGYGTFFSWPAVDEYKAILCPDGWRVPTAADFTALNTALGGSVANYVNDWGAEFGGDILNGGTHMRAGQQGRYWSQTADGDEYAYFLQLPSGGTATPAQRGAKNYGHNLRCVKAAN